MRWRPSLTAIVAAGALTAAPVAEQETGTPTERSDLVERAEVRLVQVDVTVSGPPELIRTLTADDFRVKVGLRKVRSFEFDNLCADLPAAGDPDAEQSGREGRVTETSLVRPATFIFYFDQPYLTGSGRARALQVARGLVEDLVRDGNRVMVVSNAAALRTYTGFSDDPAELIDALSELQTDRRQWDFYATDEPRRIAQVIDILNDGLDTTSAVAQARIHQREERWRTERNLRRLDAVLNRFAGVDPPKAVLYFADTMRSNAGEHYLSFFGDWIVRDDPTAARMRADSISAPLAFDRVVDDAAADGIRFYAIQGDDLQSFVDVSHMSATATESAGGAGYTSRVRIQDSQATLNSLASETGGYAFLNGAPSARIARRIREDFRCLCLISFEPRDHMVDKPYRVVIESTRPGVEARSRGRVVVRSASSRRVARLLGAFTAPETAESTGLEVRGALVPLGYEKGRFSALAQVLLPPMPLAGTTWDLGATLYGKEKVRAQVSGRLSVEAPGVPLILEREVRFPPGELEMVSVALETRSELVVSSRVDVDWPDPRDGSASVGPIALLQARPGVFLREQATRNEGLVLLGEASPVQIDRPTVLVSLVCRGRGKGAGLRVERVLEGADSVDFPPITLEEGEERCFQVRDVIPEGTLGEGEFLYEVRVLRGTDKLAGARRFLIALGGRT